MTKLKNKLGFLTLPARPWLDGYESSGEVRRMQSRVATHRRQVGLPAADTFSQKQAAGGYCK